jgi:hypothetical protein
MMTLLKIFGIPRIISAKKEPPINASPPDPPNKTFLMKDMREERTNRMIHFSEAI